MALSDAIKANFMCSHGRHWEEPCPGCDRAQADIKPSRFESSFIGGSGGLGALCAGNTLADVARRIDSPDAKIGIGGGPTRATILPTSAADRKKYPIATGLLDYFPDALAAISNLSYVGNEQHNPGQPVHWARSKSADEADTMMRHFLQRGSLDTDGIAHSVKMAWRALALLQKELETK